MFVCVHCGANQVDIQIRPGQTVGEIRKCAMQHFRLPYSSDCTARLRLWNSKHVLFDDEHIEKAPGFPKDLLVAFKKNGTAESPEPVTPSSKRIYNSLLASTQFNFDDSQFEVLKDPSVLGPEFSGPPNTVDQLFHNLKRHRQFKELLRTDFHAYVDHDALQRRIERILDNVLKSVNDESKAVPPTQPSPNAVPDVVPVALSLQLDTHCVPAAFLPMSATAPAETEAWPASKFKFPLHALDSLADLYALVARRIGVSAEALLLRPPGRSTLLPEVAVLAQEVLTRKEVSALRVQRLDCAEVALCIETVAERRFMLDFRRSYGEVVSELRKMAPQLRGTVFTLSAGGCDLLTDRREFGILMGQVYLGHAPLKVKMEVDPCGGGSVTSENEEEEVDEEDEASEAVPGAAAIVRVRQLADFVALQSRQFQVDNGPRLARLSLPAFLSDLNSRTICVRDEVVALPTVVHETPQPISLSLPARTLCYLRILVREEGRPRRFALRWLTSTSRLHELQQRVAHLTGVLPNTQSLSYRGHCLRSVDPDTLLSDLGITHACELRLRRACPIVVCPAAAPDASRETWSLPGDVRSVAQLRLLAQSRLGVDADVLRLSIAGWRLPLDGDLTACSVTPGAVLTWERPLRVRAGRCSLLLFPETPVLQLCALLREKGGMSVTPNRLQLRVKGLPGLLRVRGGNGSLAEHGIVNDFDVFIRK